MKLPGWLPASPVLFGCVAVAAVALVGVTRAIGTAREASTRNLSIMDTHDDLLLRVEQLATGFGGMFIDDDGRLTVYLLDSAQLPAARTAIEVVFGPAAIPAAGLRATAGQYSVSQLAAWTRQAARAMELPGVTLIDLDEARNRVTIAVDDSSYAPAVEQVLGSMDVPLAAVRIEVTEAIRPVVPR